MNRILKSSNFWNAVFFSLTLLITIITIVLILKNVGEVADVGVMKDIIKDAMLYEFIVFGGRTAVSGLSDIIKANKGVTYDEKEGREKIVK